MARLGTPLLGLGTWLDNEYPGAGSQTVPNTGINGNWLIIDVGLGTEHNADGSHRANVIKGSNLIQAGGNSVVDGATLEFSANKIRVKAASLNGTHLNQAAGQTVDGVTLEFAANVMRVKDGGLPLTKMGYKLYVAFVTQVGAADPTVTVIANSLGGVPVWTRIAAGLYRCSLAATFTANKVGVLFGPYGSFTRGPVYYQDDPNFISFFAYNAAGASADGMLYGTVNIMVLP